MKNYDAKDAWLVIDGKDAINRLAEQLTWKDMF